LAMKERRVCVGAGEAWARAYSGLAGIGGTSSFFFPSTSCPLAAASSLVIGPGFAPLRAAARMLAVSLGAAAAGLDSAADFDSAGLGAALAAGLAAGGDLGASLAAG